MNYVDFKCDTTQLTEDADTLIDLATQFDSAIFDFYKKLEFLSYNQDIWNGKSARAYYELSLKEKMNYNKYADGLKQVAKSLKDYANELDRTVTKSENKTESNYSYYR